MNSVDYDHLLKLVIVGDSGVGKSCFATRFCDFSYQESYISTIGACFKIRTVKFVRKNVKIILWDLAGQERFQTITVRYLPEAMGILLMYDITHLDSFENISSDWIPRIKEKAPKDVNIILVGNKSDLKNKREVSTKQGQDLANKYGFQFCEVSCKAGVNVDTTVTLLATAVIKRLVDPRFVPENPIQKRVQPVEWFRSSILWPEPFFLLNRITKLPLSEARNRSAVTEKEGILWEKGRWFPIWSKRTFLLKDHRLFYYDEGGVNQKGHVILNRAMIAVVPDSSHCFSLFVDNPFSSYPVYHLAANSEDEFLEWISVLQKVGVRLVDKNDISIQSLQEIKGIKGPGEGGGEEAPLMSAGGLEFLDGKTEFLVSRNQRNLQIEQSFLGFWTTSVCTLKSLGITSPTEIFVDDKLFGAKKFILKADRGAILFESEDRQKLLRELAGVFGSPKPPSESELFEMFRDIYYSSCSLLFTHPPEVIRLLIIDKEMKGEPLRDISVKLIPLHEEDILSLCHGLRYYPFLSSLSLPGTTLTATSLKILVDFIMEEGTVPSLSSLDLSRSFDERGDAIQMTMMILPLFRPGRADFSLRTLNLGNNHLPPRAGTMIFESMISGKDSCSLENVNLEFNKFDNSVVPSICKVLSVNTSLKSLSLAANLLSGNGAVRIVEGLRDSNFSITSLDLVGCGLIPEDEELLKELLHRNERIECW